MQEDVLEPFSLRQIQYPHSRSQCVLNYVVYGCEGDRVWLVELWFTFWKRFMMCFGLVAHCNKTRHNWQSNSNSFIAFFISSKHNRWNEWPQRSQATEGSASWSQQIAHLHKLRIITEIIGRYKGVFRTKPITNSTDIAVNKFWKGVKDVWEFVDQYINLGMCIHLVYVFWKI